MDKSTLIKTVYMNCPLCEKRHEVEVRKRITSTIIKGQEVIYEEKHYFCINSDKNESEFETGTMVNENLRSAKEAYWEKTNI